MTQIFVPGIGQYDNIGDIILRRQLLRWLRPLGRLHVFVGNAPEGYAEALELEPTDLSYRSFRSWYAAAVRSARRERTVYAAKPGEIQLTIKGMKEHVSVAPLLALIRLRGGAVIRVGAGSRNFAALPRLIMRPAIAMSDPVLWRDPATAAYLGGEVMPDLAFGEIRDVPDAEHRDLLAISLRSDRRMPSAAWISAVQQLAETRDLHMVVVTQVLRDRERSTAVAHALGADLLDWNGGDHAAQERLLRDVYRRSALVVSDRLHVLIAAVTEGARVVAPLAEASDKIERHFAAVGIEGVAVTTAELDTDGILALLTDALDRPAVDLQPVLARLAAARARVVEVIAPGRSATPAGSDE